MTEPSVVNVVDSIRDLTENFPSFMFLQPPESIVPAESIQSLAPTEFGDDEHLKKLELNANRLEILTLL